MRPQSPSRLRDVLRRRRCAVLLLTARPGGGGPASPARWRQTSVCGGVAGPGAEGTAPRPPLGLSCSSGSGLDMAATARA